MNGIIPDRTHRNWRCWACRQEVFLDPCFGSSDAWGASCEHRTSLDFDGRFDSDVVMERLFPQRSALHFVGRILSSLHRAIEQRLQKKGTATIDSPMWDQVIDG